MRLKAHYRRTGLLALAGFLLLVAAADSPVRAQATTVTTNETLPVSGTLVNPCNGDAVAFSGEARMTNHVTTDASGGFHLRTHVNYRDVEGAGSPSGATYRVITTTNETLNDPSGPQSEVTIVQIVNLISQGPLPNFLLRFKFHITINANGTTTSETIETRIECTGPGN